jgi:hypothetical protein
MGRAPHISLNDTIHIDKRYATLSIVVPPALVLDLTLLVPSPDPYYDEPMSSGLQLWSDDIARAWPSGSRDREV